MAWGDKRVNYYPYGLMMSGISSKAANSLENKYKANGGSELQNKEFSDDSGLELYDATFRMYDAQIGRFHQIDPLAELSWNWSPYTFVQDNPISFADPLGLTDSTTAPGFANSTTGANNLPGVVVTSTTSSRSQTGINPALTSLPSNAAPTLQITGNTRTIPFPIPFGIPKWNEKTGLSPWDWNKLIEAEIDLVKWIKRTVTEEPPITIPITIPAPPPPMRIALGVDYNLALFSAQVAALPYYNWGTDEPSVPSSAAYSAVIARLGMMPNVSFHFNLSTPKGRLDNPVNLAANKNSVTTAEFLTIMSNPYLRMKTTFYTQSGTIYKPAIPLSPF